MVGKQKISDYFQRQSIEMKRRRRDDDEVPCVHQVKAKHKARSEGQLSSSGATLSPKQLQRITSNKMSAKLRLLCKKLPALHPNMGLSWFEALEPEFSKPYFAKLSEYLTEERERYVIFPPEDQVYTWTRFCDIHQVKVVLLGQDPYHGKGQAHGLSFSVQKGVPPPPSLVNMYTELQNDIPGFTKPTHGNLSGWAQQGVLLLNTCLTVRQQKANSHQDRGWENLTDAVIKWLSVNLKGVVFLLWGNNAQKKMHLINQTDHLILKCCHPSPLSAHRGFFYCKHFSGANEFLMDHDKDPINWNHLPEDVNV